MRILTAVVFAVFAVSATPAQAALITVNANDFALGTDISDLFPNLSMSLITQITTPDRTYNPRIDPVVIGSDYHSETANSLMLGSTSMAQEVIGCMTRSYASSFCVQGSWGTVLELRFDAPVDFVQVGGAWLSDPPMMVAFNSAGEQISLCGPLDRGCAQTVRDEFYNFTGTTTIAREQGDIARVVYGSAIGRGAAVSVVYQVPEPATLSLLGLGAVGAFVRRRRS